ncbi:MAG TPA: nucleotidyltransferase family protein [Chthoniobacterales bacterium]|nr:nucleotidyltransferase family protein [Chthoniobacterales bacterium]
MKVGAIVLAAGASSRLGRAKQLLAYRGQTLVRRITQAAVDAGCSPVIVVLGCERERIAAELRDLPVEIVSNDNWERGLGSSLRLGVKAVADGDALVILVCDQPHVSDEVVQRLIETQTKTNCPIVASAYAETRGVPALFMRECFPALLSLGDGEGAKVLIGARESEVALIDFPEGAIDIDATEDLSRLELG